MAEALRNEHLLGEQELMSWLGYDQRKALQKRLDELRCPYTIGKGGRIATTLEAVNKALLAEGDDVEFI